MGNALTEVVTKIVDILEPLSGEERRRAIGASLTLLGDGAASPVGANPLDEQEPAEVSADLHPRAQVWMKQNNVSISDLEEIFHLANGSVEVIASEAPGKSAKEKTYAAYILTGISRLLATGSPSFDDKAARALCKSLGCFDQSNHSLYLSNHGNEFTGSRESGWSLTAPGLKRGGAIVKELNKES